MSGSKKIIPYSIANTPSLIERVFPAQRLSIEAYKEQMANQGKTLTALGSYWKGRKPLILNKACILGCLLPATNDSSKDLEVFEMLMGMDSKSLVKRLQLSSEEPLPNKSYKEIVDAAKRPEEIQDSVHSHIWEKVNSHLGTAANSFPQLVEQLGIMRFGHRPQIGDTFCGSGQIPFEAGRLGCNVFASDLNPIACMLTWGAIHLVGGSPKSRMDLETAQKNLIEQVQKEIDKLGVETDANGWRVKALLYCLETRCPETNWLVPMLPSLIISRTKRIVAKLIPDPINKRYDIRLQNNATPEDFERAARGTVRTDGRGKDPYLLHSVNGIEYRTKISTIRGDFRNPDGETGNRLRLWEKSDFQPRATDIFQERLYAIHWMRPRQSGKSFDLEFRSVSDEDLKREQIIERYIAENLCEWQKEGWIPDMRIEAGDKTDEPIRTRGWSHWHHLFNPRQLLTNGLINRFSSSPELKFGTSQAANWNSKLSSWDSSPGVDATHQTFYNQALNTLFTYGARSTQFLVKPVCPELKSFPFPEVQTIVRCLSANTIDTQSDIYVTDPPYGDAVKYEEILEFFIAWHRKTPGTEFANWTWDSRRALAIKGEDEEFRRSMVSAYKHMTECMPENGIQVIMFTHQSGSIWADMANIVWASGLHVTAAWYVVTETDSPMRDGTYVKGTVLLVLRKRAKALRTTRDDLAWDIQEEVEKQVETLTGLNQKTRLLHRDENLFADADIQMAGYAAALRVITQYSVIDGNDMTAEAIRPRISGQKSFVDELIEFAVGIANQALVPPGIEKTHWEKLNPAERFYLKLLNLENKGFNTIDNYQNFAKAFKVADFKPLMASYKANAARLKSSVELGKTLMNEGSNLANTPLRATLYAIMELINSIDGDDVLAHIAFNIENFYDQSTRSIIVNLSDYLATNLHTLRPEEASAARVLRELITNQRM